MTNEAQTEWKTQNQIGSPDAGECCKHGSLKLERGGRRETGVRHKLKDFAE